MLCAYLLLKSLNKWTAQLIQLILSALHYNLFLFINVYEGELIKMPV